jgi:hypothetical protein
MAMQDLTAKRTLVKSPPELWDELSEVERLAKHLGAFGEIKITKLEPEHRVAWEGEHASGTVSIEPSGWGTRVVLTAELAADGDPVATAKEGPPDEAPAADVSEDVAEEEPAEEPVLAPEPVAIPSFELPPRRRGFWARLFAGWLVPEERLQRAAFKARDEKVVEPTADVEEVTEEAPGAAPDPDAQEPVQVPTEETAAADIETGGEEPTEHETVVQGTAVIDHERARSVLEDTLDALGSAHHRPYSRG